MTTLIASRAQALLLGCLEHHFARDEPVYIYGTKQAAKVAVIAHMDEHGPLHGLDSFIAVDHSLAALAPATLPFVRRATLNACSRRGWVADGGVDEIETQRLGVEWFLEPRTARLRRINPTEAGAIALAGYRQKPVKPDPELGGVEKEIVEIAVRAERLGYVLVPLTDEAKRGARALARTPFAARGWGGGASTRSLRATGTGEVAIGG